MLCLADEGPVEGTEDGLGGGEGEAEAGPDVPPSRARRFSLI